jgi:hypothetical protein
MPPASRANTNVTYDRRRKKNCKNESEREVKGRWKEGSTGDRKWKWQDGEMMQWDKIEVDAADEQVWKEVHRKDGRQQVLSRNA